MISGKSSTPLYWPINLRYRSERTRFCVTLGEKIFADFLFFDYPKILVLFYAGPYLGGQRYDVFFSGKFRERNYRKISICIYFYCPFEFWNCFANEIWRNKQKTNKIQCLFWFHLYPNKLGDKKNLVSGGKMLNTVSVLWLKY